MTKTDQTEYIPKKYPKMSRFNPFLRVFFRAYSGLTAFSHVYAWFWQLCEKVSFPCPKNGKKGYFGNFGHF
jgi:hypothetical protein